MAFVIGTPHVLEPAAPRGRRLPIDHFFRSLSLALSLDQHERAIGLVLSGSGSDGTLGIEAIKGEGGTVMVRNTDAAEHGSMPCSAIAMGLVDYVLPPAEVFVQLIAYGAHASGMPPRPATRVSETENALRWVFAGKGADAAIRVWVPGCSAGEEAFSLAIVLAERQEAPKQSFRVQVFATDIDSHAIAAARAGVYRASFAADLTSERLTRTFVAEPGEGAYRDDDLEKRLIPLFHVNPGGHLLLGASETVNEFGDQFAATDRRQRVFLRMDDLVGATRAGLGRLLPPMTAPDAEHPRTGGKVTSRKKLPLRELTEQALLQQVVQAAALVDAGRDLLSLHGRTGMYLEPSPGESEISSILTMAREGLRRDLTTALHRAAVTGRIECRSGLRVQANGGFTTVDLTVRPVAVAPSEPPSYLVVLEQSQAPVIQVPAGQALSQEPASEYADARIAGLERELQAKEQYLQTANEELEASKEELQSVNQEPSTVNAELQTTVADLPRTNNDMNSLLACTGSATDFVDHQLRILRFTRAATRIHHQADPERHRPARIPHHRQPARLRHADGEHAGAVLTFVDVTAARTLQETLRVNAERRRLALGAAINSVFDQDTKLRSTWTHDANPALPLPWRPPSDEARPAPPASNTNER